MLRFSRHRHHRSSPTTSKQLFPRYPFDGVFVLNLDKRTDRWRSVQHQLKRAKLFDSNLVTRVSGIEPGVSPEFPVKDADWLLKQGIITEMAARRLVDVPDADKLFGMDLTFGAVGCALGHRMIWSRVVELNLDCALILEDDVEFHPAIAKVFASRWKNDVVPFLFSPQQQQQQQKENAPIVYLGGVDLLKEGKPPRPFFQSSPGLRRAYKGHRELTAYVVSAASAQRCLELTKPMTWQIDTHICERTEYEEAAQDDFISDPPSFVMHPSLAIQVAKFGTDVQKQPDSAPSLTDASRRMREFVGGETSVR